MPLPLLAMLPMLAKAGAVAAKAGTVAAGAGKAAGAGSKIMGALGKAGKFAQAAKPYAGFLSNLMGGAQETGGMAQPMFMGGGGAGQIAQLNPRMMQGPIPRGRAQGMIPRNNMYDPWAAN